MNQTMNHKFLIPSLLLASVVCFAGCRGTHDYRGMQIDPVEKEMGYLTSENGSAFLPFILGGYTTGPKSLVYSVPLLSWYVNSNQHKGYAFIAPFIYYDIDSIYYASDNRMAGYKNVTFLFLGLIGSTHSLTGVHPRGEEVERTSYWLFPLFMGGEDEEGSYFNLLMILPIF